MEKEGDYQFLSHINYLLIFLSDLNANIRIVLESYVALMTNIIRSYIQFSVLY